MDIPKYSSSKENESKKTLNSYMMMNSLII